MGQWSKPSRSDVQYPTTNLTSAQQRQALQDALVTPLLQLPAAAVAFRVVWRGSEDGKDLVWKNILTHRHYCDEQVKTMPEVGLFLSSISGVVTRPPKPALPTVSPALAYWVVLKPGVRDDSLGRERIKHMQIHYQGSAEVKALHEPPLVHTMEAMNSSLYVAMKDHANGFVKKKIAESIEEPPGDMMDLKCPVRIVVLDSDMSSLANQAYQLLGDNRININLLYK